MTEPAQICDNNNAILKHNYFFKMIIALNWSFLNFSALGEINLFKRISLLELLIAFKMALPSLLLGLRVKSRFPRKKSFITLTTGFFTWPPPSPCSLYSYSFNYDFYSATRSPVHC